LQIHQDQIDPLFLYQVDPAPDQLLVSIEAIAPKDGIGPDLPDHQVGMLGDDVFAQAEDLLAEVLPTYYAIEHADLDRWKAVLQLLLETARILIVGSLAPTPCVEDEPIATMVKGSACSTRMALRSSAAAIADNDGGVAQLLMTFPAGWATAGPLRINTAATIAARRRPRQRSFIAALLG
jgi:hypothetical protein